MESHTSEDLTRALLSEVQYRLFDEFLPRILTCLDQLNNEQIWWRPNENSNSIGNLILHLCGNVRQWISSGLGGQPDSRKRQSEFDERRVLDKEKLVSELLSTMMIARAVILEVTTQDLLTRRKVQTFTETGLTILVHVTEHFSYHTGQIAYITKLLTGNSLGFYNGVPLE